MKNKVTICENCFDEISEFDNFCQNCGSQFDQSTKDIQVTHPGLLELPENAFVEWNVGKLVKHFITLAKTKGKADVMKGILNLERWNKSKEPDISKKARQVIEKLKGNSDWESL